MRVILERDETMRKPRWYPQLAQVDGIKQRADPAAECRRTAANVHRDVERAAARHPHEFALRVRRDLIVQAAKNPTTRLRMVVLNEAHGVAHGVVERALIPAFHEETAVVPKHAGFDHQDLW